MSRKLGVRPEDALYCGDTVYDIQAARSAGVPMAAVAGPPQSQRGYHSRERLEKEKPDYILNSLLDLTDTKVS